MILNSEIMFQTNQYVKRQAGKFVKGILQNKAYKVEYSTNRWVKLIGIPKKYSTKYFIPANQTENQNEIDILKHHMNNWKPLFFEDDFLPDRFRKLCELAYKHNASNFLIESITKNLIK